MATVLESYALGKNGDPGGGEDRVVIGQHFLAVFDGVTSRGRAVDEQLRIAGSTPGQWAAITLSEATNQLAHNVSADEAFAFLAAALRDGMAANGLDPEAWGWPAAAQATLYSNARREIWRLGDTLISVNGARLEDMPTPLDEPAVGYRAAALWALRASGAPVADLVENDPTWPMLLPLLELQHHLRNCRDSDNPFAYALLDGRELADGCVQVISVLPGDEVVLTSDGYPEPLATLTAAEAHLADVLTRDPLLIDLHRSFRPVPAGYVSFDDRAYLRFRA